MIMNRLSQLEEFLKSDPEDAFLKYAIATEYLKMGDEQQARACFEDLLVNNPSYIGTYYHAAALYLKLGDLEKAVSTYKAGLKAALQAGDKHAWRELKAALALIEDDDNEE